MDAIVTNVHGNVITEAAQSTGRGPFKPLNTLLPTILYAARDPCPLVILSYTVNKSGFR